MSTPSVGPPSSLVGAETPPVGGGGPLEQRSSGQDLVRRSPWGWPDRVAGALRRRIGLAFVRVRFPRARFGQLCDVRRQASIRVGREARVSFGDRCVLDQGFTLECSGVLSVGSDTIFGHHCTVAAAEDVSIGDNCLIAELVSIRDHDHAFHDQTVPIRLQGQQRRPIRIGNNVWLGAKVTVTSGVTIGDGAVVGANAVVTRDIPPGAVAVGIPARVIRRRAAEDGPHDAPKV